jgi:hypothetical protein
VFSIFRVLSAAVYFILIFHIPLVSAGTVSLPQTGQTTCYNAAGDSVACVDTGQDGEHTFGEAWPSPRFTDNGNGTLTDELTGLTWLKDANCAATVSHDPDETGDGTMDWANSLLFISQINSGAGGFTDCNAGFNDWRLPNVNELETLVNAEVANLTWLTDQGFTNPSGGGGYWSSTTSTNFLPGNGVFVDLSAGAVSNTDKNDVGGVLPVRGGQLDGNVYLAYPANVWRTGQTTSYTDDDDGTYQAGVEWPAPRFTDIGDGTVTDNLTNLMWLKDANCIASNYAADYSADGEVTWATALEFINQMNSGARPLCASSYDDWRLANRKELLSLVDRSQSNPALPAGHPFENTPLASAYYWSSTTYANNTLWAWRMWTRTGDIGGAPKSNLSLVWPVRGGAAAAPEPDIALDPASINFGSVTIGQSPAEIATVSNLGTATLTISLFELDGVNSDEFALNNNGGNAPCGNTPVVLAASASCTVAIQFVPASAGAKVANFHVTSDDPDEPAAGIDLSGTGVSAQVPNISVDVEAIDFGAVVVGETPSQDFTITNTGGAVLNYDADLTNFDDPAFELGAQYSGTLQPEESFTGTVTFAPPGAGDYQNAVRIISNDPDTEGTLIQLAGTGVAAGVGPDITVTPTSYTFLPAPIGGASPPVDFTIANDGDQTLSVTEMRLQDAVNFTIDLGSGTAPCAATPVSLEPGMSCTVGISFTPQSDLGAYGTILIIESNDPDEVRTDVPLNGNAIEIQIPLPDIEVTPLEFDFGIITRNGISEPLEVLIENVGQATLQFSDIALTDTRNYDLDLSAGANPCVAPASQLNAGGSCTLSVTFNPADIGNLDARLNIDSDDPYSPRIIVSLLGFAEPGSGGGPSCFVATAAYGSYLEPEVVTLRQFRDDFLLTNRAGRALVAFYYRHSPPIANYISQHDSLRALTRWALTPIVYSISYPKTVFVFLAGSMVFVLRRRKKKQLQQKTTALK